LNGTGANGGPSLVSQSDRDAVVEQVRNGGGGMPAFKGSLSEKEIQDVASYVTERIAKNGG
jgi:mono/diheme cytochrome c family protein